VIALFLAAALAATAATPQARLPNFVVILADDLGYGDLGCYGSTAIRTPNLDRMAAEGARLTSFYTTAPICSPTRASLLTGRYPQRAGVPFVLFPRDRKGLAPEEITIAEVLKPRGYATACIGKWHLGTQPELAARRQGFDFFFGLPYSNDSRKRLPGEPQRAVLADVELPLLRDESVLEAPVRQELLTERYTEEAIRFIRDHRTRPFFLYLPQTFPHMPLCRCAGFTGTAGATLYANAVECVDWSTGRILEELRRLGLERDTLVVFTSDNGAPAVAPRVAAEQGAGSAGPLRGAKFTTYEGGMRVPSIWWWPGKIPAGTTTAELATIMDLLPTFARLAGAAAPSDRILDGRDIGPLLFAAPGAKSPHEAFYYYLYDQLQAVRRGPWKLVLEQHDPYPDAGLRGEARVFYELGAPGMRERQYPLRHAPELYDLDADIGEARNVAAAHPEVVRDLTRLAREFDAALIRNRRPEMR
jgi:arylsulfatase A